MADNEGFLSRWSRRKTQLARGEQPPEAAEAATPRPAAVAERATAPMPRASAADAAEPPPPPPPPAPPPPTLEDVARLGPEATDFSRFVARDVAPEVKNAALKKLFADPHFNVMDGLDIYIDDYGKPDPLPAGMLRQLVQGRALGLFPEDEAQTTATAGSPAQSLPPTDNPAPVAADAEPMPNEDPDLRLQPHDAAGRPGDPAGAVEEPRGAA
jgi:hypothetical protein